MVATIGKDGVEAAISMVVVQWHGRDVPKVRVVDDIVDIPERARRVVADADGVFDSDAETVYLIGNRITTAKQARRALAREVINHYSLMQILGGDFELRIADVIRLIESGDPKVSAIADDVREGLWRGCARESARRSDAGENGRARAPSASLVPVHCLC